MTRNMTTEHPPTIRSTRGLAAELVALAKDGSALYFHELPKGRATPGAHFRATAKHYYRRDEAGRVRKWTRTVRSGARQTGHLRPQPPEIGRWSWLKAT